MNFFGLGLEEILFIVLLILVIFAPGDIQRAGRAIGRGLNRLARSETWRLLRQAGEELRTLPGRLMREAQLDELHELHVSTLEEIKENLPSGAPLSEDEATAEAGERKPSERQMEP